MRDLVFFAKKGDYDDYIKYDLMAEATSWECRFPAPYRSWDLQRAFIAGWNEADASDNKQQTGGDRG